MAEQTLETQLQEAVTKYVESGNKIHKFANGAETETVTTENGVIPTLAKINKDNLDTIAASRTELDSKVADVSQKAAQVALKKTEIDTLISNTETLVNNQSAELDNLKESASIDLPISDSIFYAGEFDASKQFYLKNNIAYNYDDYSFNFITSQSTYITHYVNSLSSDDFELVIKCSFEQLAKRDGIADGGHDSIETIILQKNPDNTIGLLLSSNGSSWDITSGHGIKNDWTPNQIYLFRIFKDTPNSQWLLQWSDDDGQSWNTDLTVNSSLKIYNMPLNIHFGRTIYGSDGLLSGKIFLDKTYLRVGGVELIKPQSTDYIPNTVIWKGTARSDDNTTNIVANDYLRSSQLNKSEIPVMASNSQSGYVSSASTTLNSKYESFKAFNNKMGFDLGGRWTANTNTGWLKIQLPLAKQFKYYMVQSSSGFPSALTESPKTWTLEASNTGAFSGEEVILDTQNNVTDWVQGEWKAFNFQNNTPYLYYRINITENNGATNLNISELKLSETILSLDNFYLFAGKNSIGETVLEFDIDIKGSNLINIVGAKRIVYEDKPTSQGEIYNTVLVSTKAGSVKGLRLNPDVTLFSTNSDILTYLTRTTPKSAKEIGFSIYLLTGAGTVTVKFDDVIAAQVGIGTSSVNSVTKATHLTTEEVIKLLIDVDNSAGRTIEIKEESFVIERKY